MNRFSTGERWRNMGVRSTTASASPSVQGIREQQLQHCRVGLLGQHAIDDRTGRRRHLAGAVSPVPSLSHRRHRHPLSVPPIASISARRLERHTCRCAAHAWPRQASGTCLLFSRHFPRTTKFVQRHCRPQLAFSFFNACPLLRRELSCQFAKVVTATHINPSSVNSSKCSS